MGVARVLPQEAPLTAEDLDAFPDDGNRYELLDGYLLVSPAPNVRHQVVATALLVLLHSAAPRHLRVLPAPTEWRASPGNTFQPDLLVADRSAFGPARLEAAPLLVVEVLSPSNRITDLTLKRAAYERAGVEWYWVVDPESPSLNVLHLDAGAYVEVTRVEGHEAYDAAEPFAVAVVPARLLD